MEFTTYNTNSKCKEKIIQALKVSLKSIPEFMGVQKKEKFISKVKIQVMLDLLHEEGSDDVV